MIYWLLSALLLATLIILFNQAAQRRLKAKKLQHIRESWGQVNPAYRNFTQIGKYLSTKDPKDYLSDATKTDLGTEEIFNFIDRTHSKPGQQVLFEKLHRLNPGNADLELLERKIAQLTANDKSREEIELALTALGQADAYYLPELFQTAHQSPFNKLSTWYIHAAPFLVVILITLIGSFPKGYLFLMLLGILIINACVHFFNKKYIFKYTHSLPQLLQLCQLGQFLQNQNCFKDDEQISQCLQRIGKLRRRLGLIYFQNKEFNDPTDFIYLIKEWFRMLLLIEPLLFLHSIKMVNRYRVEIKTLYLAVAEIDVAIAVGSVRAGLPYFCKPEFIEAGYFDVQDIYHPLISDCVANSINGDDKRVILVTGSNMSGKTTFIRAVAINALLAQSIYTCCAKSYSVPKLQILTSIHMSDDLEAGQSYFQAEASAVLTIVNQATLAGKRSLVIIDEIFRGTNTIERIAAATAVLSHLIAQGNLVFVSTHDLELAELLGDENVVYSFEERVTNEGLVFDYKIKAGILKNRNGIAVLKKLGYPQAIVDLAYQTSQQLRKKYELN